MIPTSDFSSLISCITKADRAGGPPASQASPFGRRYGIGIY